MDRVPTTSSNVRVMEVSAIKEMAMRSAKVPGAASLTWGLPSFRTPEHIRGAVADALESDIDVGKYTLPDGLPALRELVARTHCARTGVTVDPDRNILITAGNMQGLNALLHVFVNPGDEVIVTDPGFASHFQQIKLVGGQPVHWRLDEKDGWSLDVEALSDLIGDRTKAIILVTPSNPTGKIFSKESLLAAGRVARERSIPILLDDPYSDFTYENAQRYFNLACDPEMFERLAYLFTFSKSYAMSGWRLGYMVMPEWMKKQVLKVHDATLICAPRVSQMAGIAALDEPRRHLDEFVTALARRRQLICERLNAVPHVFDYVKPEGAYYVFPRITADHEDSREFALRLLDEAKVTVTPGRAFGPSGEHHVRMAYCVEGDVIEMAFDRIERHFGR